MKKQEQIKLIANMMCQNCIDRCGADYCPLKPNGNNMQKNCYKVRLEDAENFYNRGLRYWRVK